MPVYQYACKYCSKLFEERRPMSDSSNPCDCPTCGNRAERIISGFGSYEIRGDNSASTPPSTTVSRRNKSDGSEKV